MCLFVVPDVALPCRIQAKQRCAAAWGVPLKSGVRGSGIAGCRPNASTPPFEDGSRHVSKGRVGKAGLQPRASLYGLMRREAKTRMGATPSPDLMVAGLSCKCFSDEMFGRHYLKVGRNDSLAGFETLEASVGQRVSVQ